MEKLKFAHLADLHLGSWREKTLNELNLKTFQLAIDKVIDSKVDFCIFCGDIFNSALPGIDVVKSFVTEIKKLQKNNIKVYVIGGSHDYSLIGKSFIELLDEVGILIDVCKLDYIDKNKIKLLITQDKNLKLNIAGLYGKKNSLDKKVYDNLIVENLDEDYFNLFLFHSSMNDFKPKSLNNVDFDMNTSFLPKGFDYYAGGHIHENMLTKFNNNSVISYSGALFPNNFSELKNFVPVFNICTFDFKSKKIDVEKKEINSFEKEYLIFEFDNENPINAQKKINDKLELIDVKDKIILVEFKGIIDGKISDININKIVNDLYRRDVKEVLKNTYKLKTKLLESIGVDLSENLYEVEDRIIKKHLEKSNDFKKEYDLSKKLLNLDLIKEEEERNIDYENRVIKEIDSVLDVFE